MNSYYAFPGTCYSFMLERTKLLSDSLEDGFAPIPISRADFSEMIDRTKNRC